MNYFIVVCFGSMAPQISFHLLCIKYRHLNLADIRRVGIQKEINEYKTFVTLHCHRPNLAATAEAKDLTAPTADEERGARSHPTAKSALIRKNTT